MYPQHHALLYVGRESFDLSDFQLVQQGVRDVIVQEYSEFRIDDARNLVTLATSTPTHCPLQCFVIMADSVANEAQNALLKLLEEPPDVSSFIFVLPKNTLLPTLRSRFMVMETVHNSTVLATVFLDFLAEAIPARLTRIETLIEKKNTDDLTLLQEGLLMYLDRNKRSFAVAQVRRILWLSSQMQLRGASIKMLWEEVAFTLPVDVSATT